MEKLQRTNHFSETEVKLYIGDWLTKSGFHVFDEKPNKERPQWGVFEVRNINRGKRRDLVVRGNLRAAHTLKQDVYVAIEIKRGYKHHDILNGFDAILFYSLLIVSPIDREPLTKFPRYFQLFQKCFYSRL